MTTAKTLKRTPLYEFHRTHGKMAEFAGYEMPIWYSSTIEEHMAVRNAAGIFDVSHMGRVDVSGRDATVFVEKLFPSNIAKQPGGKSVYTLLLNEGAGIIDDLIVLKVDQEHFMVVINAASRTKDLAHMRKVGAGLDLRMEDMTEATTMIAVQGPAALETLQPLTPLPLAGMKRFTHAPSTVRGIQASITRTGYTGEDGFELILYDAAEGAFAAWDGLMKKGARPCALGARDSLRLEAGLPLYGSDMDENTNPIEADLGWVVSKDKQSYVGHAALSAIIQRGPSKLRRGILMHEGIPRHGFRVTDQGGSDLGVVTSGTFSPVLKRGIAMAYVKTQYSDLGNRVKVVIRDALADGGIVRFPFYDETLFGWKRKQGTHQ